MGMGIIFKSAVFNEKKYGGFYSRFFEFSFYG